MTLMTLASVAMADDAKMKALLVGTWTPGNRITYTFTSDGRFLVADPSQPNWDPLLNLWGWDIRDGNLIIKRPLPETDRDYTILSLTKHKCVIQQNGYDNNIQTLIRR